MSAVERVRAAYAAIAAADRPEIWITLRPLTDALADAEQVDASDKSLPLAGLVAAVKNNIDIAGIATTAACPGYADGPAAADATVVTRLRAAGAVIIGATNLDQFATGLVGTRSPHGAVRDSRRPEYISGGSSSGSAVAVALGLVDIALGTDTAGSGRVPAALQGIVGIKPTLGVVPTDGVVPACRSYDCVTVFARDIDTADTAVGVIAGGARHFPADAPLAAPPLTRVAVPRALPGLSPEWAQAFRAAADRLATNDIEIVEIDLDPFLEAARLLYDGGLVAERHDAVGAFVDAHRDDEDLDPTVAGIIAAAGAVPATRLLADRVRLDELTATAMAELGDCHALLIPTTTGHPTIAEVNADPVGVNSRMGTYTNFCNLMDLCAVAVPSGTDAQGTQFGVSVLARAGADALALDLARMVTLHSAGVTLPGAASVPAPAAPWPARAGLDTTALLVVGAHLRGQPLAWQLDDRGARWCGPVRTAPRYRLARLDTDPPKPGLARVAPGDGAAIYGELWLIGTAMLGDFLAALPAPMSLGRATLADGTEVVGFGCTAEAWDAGQDITHHGDWPGYLRRVGRGAEVTRSDLSHRSWRRLAMAVPGAVVDTTTEVQWLQAGELYIDLRTPAGMAEITGRALDELTREDLLALCEQQAFAGRLEDDGAEWTWWREVDLHPADPLPDRGGLHLIDGILVETGIGRDYFEDWAAETHEVSGLELALHDDTGRPGLLLRVGAHFGYVRGRAAGIAPAPGMSLRDAVACADLESARALLDLEVSLGTVEDDRWLISRSTLPFRVGDDLAPELGSGEITVAERDTAGTPVRRRWTVALDRSEPLLAL
ncbi:allophanate hydrolase [Mycolicibacterium frederiksbergense]|uniref:Allophanate hydrolase n=1 Tax=Mycolicibacterium frederiksbergense TaxID=117567 RepID=A0A6H0S1D9_9MYCO|nr:allophanate hydrolase [Mycolicibacterium frederiksbergense]QIV80511.1 allophanate hydrolase [Mycolicibacterium frederiksbergense]